MCRGNPRTLGTRANFASTPLVGGSQPATESADGQRGRDHALLRVHRRGGSTVRRRDNECVTRAVRELGVSRTFVTAQGTRPRRVSCARVLSFSRKVPSGRASRRFPNKNAARAAARARTREATHERALRRRDKTRLFTRDYDYASHPERLLPPPRLRPARTRARRLASPPGPKTPATASTGSPRRPPRRRATPRTRRRCEVSPCARSWCPAWRAHVRTQSPARAAACQLYISRTRAWIAAGESAALDDPREPRPPGSPREIF